MKHVIFFVSLLVLSGCNSQQKYFPFSDPTINVVQPLTIGPMIGNVTESSFRLWGRGTKYSVGVVRVREAKNRAWEEPVTFKLKFLTDHTGTVELTRLYGKALKPETTYKYQIGHVHNRFEKNMASIVWGEKHQVYTVRTFPKKDSNTNTRFILGSCRDQTIWSDKGEDTFGNINKLLKKEKETGLTSQFIIQLGDQVYVDLDHNPWDKKHIPI